MTVQASFAIKGRNPDVLTCIANLSNDEVFTPPEFANRMLDTLAEGWAAANDGADIWADSKVTFLDPCTKSGVFLREIATRLIKGLGGEIPDLQSRVDHILTRQLFGIGITQLTALLARRSLYCSKHATGPHSVAREAFGGNDDGNIWFERTEHVRDGDRCRICGAGKAFLDRGPGEENHAYAFIHASDIKARLGELFGGTMHFDVIIGNPPYQMTGGAGGTSDSSIYHLFVEQAFRLEPRFVSMVIPSRWMAGGRGMDEFRANTLSCGKLRTLVDHPISKEVFPGVSVEGGLCYFLWDRDHEGETEVTVIRGDDVQGPVSRSLGEFDIFVRDPRAVGILHRVRKHSEPSVTEILTGDTPFGIATNFENYEPRPRAGDVELYLVKRGKRSVGYLPRKFIKKNAHLIDKWKVLTPKARGSQGIPDVILGKPIVAPPNSVCTQTFIAFWFDSEGEAKSLQSYYSTKFFRFLVSLRKITQDALRGTYSWVPQQRWDHTWTDAELYEKYDLTQEQIDYVESVIKPMELDLANDA